MPHREVIRAEKLGGQFAGHSRQHARRIAKSATEPFRDRLSDGREFLDLYEYQLALGDELDRIHDELLLIDDRHAAELAIDRVLREQRQRWFAELREELIQLKKTVDGYAGPGASRQLFKEASLRLPNDPVAMYQLAQRIWDTLNDPDFVLEPAQSGVVVNPRVLAKNFETPLLKLAEVLRQLHASESETKHTQSLKDEALKKAEKYSAQVARFYEALFDLAGHELLSDRLRRSSHLRPEEVAPAADPGSPDPGSPDPGSPDPANDDGFDPANDEEQDAVTEDAA